MKKKYFIVYIFFVFYGCDKETINDAVTQDDNPNSPSQKYISIFPETTFQTIDGFGAGIKRRTEDLYRLNSTIREKVEAYCFKDLEVNMIRFFVYHDLEPENDNNDPYDLDESQLDWTRYNSNINNSRSRFIGEALNNAFNLSTNGFDHIIGNCNSAPGWLKTNGQHNNGGTLISGKEEEYNEFLIAFLKGMKSRYNVDVTAISPTNEPDFEVTYESMNTTPTELSSILTKLDTRLDQVSLSNVKIISPECFRVHSPSDNTKGSTNYVNDLFADTNVETAVDIVATHTYADKDHTANWSSLKAASRGKQVWVTESAFLKTFDHTMTDAAYYAKWMMRGFNEGGLTAYMAHLFYEEADDVNGYSAMVAWRSNGEIVLPKRYFTFKHFTNLVKPGYKRIDTEISNVDLYVSAFISEDNKEIVVQILNEGNAQDISLDLPETTTEIDHYITSDLEGENFKKNLNIQLPSEDNFITITLPPLSMHSLVYKL